MTPVLPGAPWLIAHRTMVGINRPYEITLNGRDYVLWQTAEGQLFALDNSCPHMQAPLSNGWVCQERQSITCPFHALEFSGDGRLLTEGKPSGQPIAKPLDLVIQGDLIWTYGGFSPRLPIPDLIPRKTNGLKFLGATGARSIQADFLSCIKINYDFNHQNGSHRETFRVRENPIHRFEAQGHIARVDLTFIREDNTFKEILDNPAILSLPKRYQGQLDYVFPSLVVFRAEVDLGHLPQVFVLYPETESRTRIFVLCYGTWNPLLLKLPGVNQFMTRSLLKATAVVTEQDAKTVESLYPSQPPQIRLPHEDIMAYVEQLYRDW
ncbi:MAG: Rieske 2Fe-2S domain-containing protein [Kaiparowitsia implicata GSE-PSE-MK54-09C]|jgi:phenylpropionate dioxygenase-like ring-hydroxylating dioxygenase large terminal subunit|nr:Rieske 2Fe-2S domain-containing protein [Kaiparowitsia implicata GSE-PSE-MK54-09C]